MLFGSDSSSMKRYRPSFFYLVPNLADCYLVSALSSMRLIKNLCEVLHFISNFIQCNTNLLFRVFETGFGASSESSS